MEPQWKSGLFAGGIWLTNGFAGAKMISERRGGDPGKKRGNVWKTARRAG